MGSIEVPVINSSAFDLPIYQTAQSAGVDLRANIQTSITIAPMERILVPTGLSLELPIGYEAQIRPRSGLAYKHGITILNSPGTIDADYRGEIKALLINLSTESFVIEPGERIAQMVLSKHETLKWKPVEKLSESERGIGGYGSTGKK